MKKLYIHDDGTVLCKEHAGAELSASLEHSPKKKIHWTPLGTWELAADDYYAEFTKFTGVQLDCESCSPIMQRASIA